MTSLGTGDAELHYDDGGHRWLCPQPDATVEALEAWSAKVKQHMAEHQSRMLASFERRRG
jgi:hypothetical protein